MPPTPASPPDQPATWELFVPVKSPRSAKTRLSGVLDDRRRRDLVVDMFTATVTACLAAPGVAAVTVVTPDAGMAELAERLGARAVKDPPAPSDGGGADRGTGRDPHNRALAHALPEVLSSPVGVVSADLPLLTPGVVGAICAAAAKHRSSYLADHSGRGTTMAFWTPGAPPHGYAAVPLFGPRSAREFLVSGAVPLVAPTIHGDPWLRARQDVDTPADLAWLLRDSHRIGDTD